MLNKKGLLVVLTLLALLFLLGCSSDGEMDGIISEENEVDTKIKSIAKFETGEDKFDEEIIDRETIVEEEDGEKRKYELVTKRFSINQNAHEFMLYNPQVSMLWPGNIIQGETLREGNLKTMYLDREPIDVTLAIIAGDGGEKTMTIEEPSYSAANRVMNDILADYDGGTPAKYTFDYEEIYSAEHLNYKLNLGFGSYLDLDFEKKKVEEKNVALVKLSQEYFTMLVDPITSPSDVFASNVSHQDLDPYIGPDNPPTYIDSVTFGRKFHLIYFSEAEREELKAAISATLGFVGGGGGIDYGEVMEKTEVEAFQLGGNAQEGLLASLADPTSREGKEKLQRFLYEGGAFDKDNVGLPISYTARYLKDSTLAAINNAFNYEITKKIPLGGEIEFADSNLEVAISNKLGLQPGELTLEDVRTIEHLDLINLGIQTLSGIQHLENLRLLNISGNNVDTLKYISNLENLEHLVAEHTNRVYLSELSSIDSLETLILNHNHIDNLRQIRELPNLKSLHLGHNNLVAINDLLELNSLEQVNLTANPLDQMAAEVVAQLQQQGVEVILEEHHEAPEQNPDQRVIAFIEIIGDAVEGGGSKFFWHFVTPDNQVTNKISQESYNTLAGTNHDLFQLQAPVPVNTHFAMVGAENGNPAERRFRFFDQHHNLIDDIRVGPHYMQNFVKKAEEPNRFIRFFFNGQNIKHQFIQ